MSHPHIIELIEVFDFFNEKYLVTELVPGKSMVVLDDVLKRKNLKLHKIWKHRFTQSIWYLSILIFGQVYVYITITFNQTPNASQCFWSKIKYVFAGGDLFDAIAVDTKYSEPVSRRMVSDLTSALQYLHDKMIVHRDIKPENLLVI